MKKFFIKLSTIEDVRNFVNIVTRQDFDIDLSSGRYTVDAKSIMGIFSLDLLNKIEATAHTENIDGLLAELKDLVVE